MTTGYEQKLCAMCHGIHSDAEYHIDRKSGATTAENINITEVQRLRLEPGDIVVLKSEHKLSLYLKDDLLGHLKTTFPHNTCLVLDEGMDLSIVRPADAVGRPEKHH